MTAIPESTAERKFSHDTDRDPDLAAHLIAAKFGLLPHVAALVATLAGLGARR